MTDKVNEWGQTFKVWCAVTHDELVHYTGQGLGDVQDDVDLGDSWETGQTAADIARALGLLSPDEMRDVFGDDESEEQQ
jgi:hypothetical protein